MLQWKIRRLIYMRMGINCTYAKLKVGEKLNYKELLYIKTVADEESISNAARKLNISQPALSQILKKVETELDEVLFDRTNRGMLLTEVGRKYYDLAEKTLGMYDDFLKEIDVMKNTYDGELNIGVSSFIETTILPIVIKEFNKVYPNIRINVRESNCKELESFVKNKEVDFSIVHRATLEENHYRRLIKLGEDPFILLTTPGLLDEKDYYHIEGEKYPIVSLDKVKDEMFITYPTARRIRDTMDDILKYDKVVPNYGIELPNFLSVKKLVSIDRSVSLMPSKYAEYFNVGDSLDLYYIEDNPLAKWYTCIYYRPEEDFPEYAKVFIDLLINLVKEEDIL